MNALLEASLCAVRVELFSQKDRYLFVHIEADEWNGFMNDPKGWDASGLPSIAKLAGRVRLRLLRAIRDLGA